MSTAPLTPAEPAVPPSGQPQGTPPRRWQPSRGALVAALVVAVVLLVGSVGATAAWVHAAAHTSFGITREAPNGRMFMFPGEPKGDAGPQKQFQMPMNPGRHHPGKAPAPGKTSPAPSPTSSAG